MESERKKILWAHQCSQLGGQGTGFWTPNPEVKSWHSSTFFLPSLVYFACKMGPYLYFLWNTLSCIYQKGSLVSTFPFWDGISVLNSESKSLNWAKFEQGKKGWIRHLKDWQRHLVCSNLRSCSSWEGVIRTAKPNPTVCTYISLSWKQTYLCFFVTQLSCVFLITYTATVKVLESVN